MIYILLLPEKGITLGKEAFSSRSERGFLGKGSDLDYRMQVRKMIYTPKSCSSGETTYPIRRHKTALQRI